MENNELIIRFLSGRLPALKGIYLFGSRAEGRARPDSDIDLAFLVEWGHSPRPVQRWEWAVELSELLHGITVDLIDLLAEAGIIEDGLSKELGAMAGFRNIAAHNYTKLDLAVVKAIIETRLPTFLEFPRIALGYA